MTKEELQKRKLKLESERQQYVMALQQIAGRINEVDWQIEQLQNDEAEESESDESTEDNV